MEVLVLQNSNMFIGLSHIHRKELLFYIQNILITAVSTAWGQKYSSSGYGDFL